MKIIRFLVRGLITWSLLLFLLGMAFAASPHAAKDVLGLLVVAVLAGGVASLFIRRPDPASPTGQPVVRAATETAPEQELPAERGARTALAHRIEEAPQPHTLAVCLHGELKAYVTRESWLPVGEFADLGPDDLQYGLVSLMSVYAQSVLEEPGAFYTEQDAVVYALAEIVPHELLEHDMPNPDGTAAALGLPPDVLTPQNLRALRAAIAERDAAQPAASEWRLDG